MPNEIKVDSTKKIGWKDRKSKKIEIAKRSETFTLNSVKWKKNVKECLLCKSMKKKTSMSMRMKSTMIKIQTQKL